MVRQLLGLRLWTLDSRRWTAFALSPFSRFPLCIRADPHQHLAALVDRESFPFDKFKLEVFKRFIIQYKLALEGSISQPPLVLQPRLGLSEDFGKFHNPSTFTSRRRRASLRKLVAKLYAIVACPACASAAGTGELVEGSKSTDRVTSLI